MTIDLHSQLASLNRGLRNLLLIGMADGSSSKLRRYLIEPDFLSA